MSTRKIVLTLYVIEKADIICDITRSIEQLLREHYCDEDWKLEVIDVLSMPEKAMENDIYATPTIVREFPLPMLKVLGDISMMKDAQVFLSI